MLYIDSSAALKRVFLEEESHALVAAIDAAQNDDVVLITSTLSEVEITRALLRASHLEQLDVATAAANALNGFAFAPITSGIVGQARVVPPTSLRSLDAIHLATAVAVGASELWTYDARLAEACATAGIRSRSPGRD